DRHDGSPYTARAGESGVSGRGILFPGPWRRAGTSPVYEARPLGRPRDPGRAFVRQSRGYCQLASRHGRKADQGTPPRPVAGIWASPYGPGKGPTALGRIRPIAGLPRATEGTIAMNLIAQLEAEQIAALG